MVHLADFSGIEDTYKGFRGDSARDLRQMEVESGAQFGTNEFAKFFGFPLPNPVKAPVTATNQRPGVLASPLPERTSGTGAEGRNVATKDITQEQADFLRQNGFSLDGFNVRGVDATTGLFSPKGGGALTPQQIIAAVRSGELAEGPALQALTQLFGGNANSARAYFNAASKGQSVSISQQNGVWSLQTDRPPPLDTNKRSFDQDLDRQIFGDDSTLKDDPFSFDEAFGNQGRRAQVTAFLGEQFPGIGGTFRNVIEGFRNPIANAFTVSKAFGGGDVLEDFLGTLGGANPRISDPQFGRLSDLIAAGPGAIGAGPEFDIQRSTLEGLTSPSGQRRQFELATNQRQRDLAFDLRGSFGRLADRRFDEILAEQGKDPAFQFLPFVQQRGLFGG